MDSSSTTRYHGNKRTPSRNYYSKEQDNDDWTTPDEPSLEELTLEPEEFYEEEQRKASILASPSLKKSQSVSMIKSKSLVILNHTVLSEEYGRVKKRKFRFEITFASYPTKSETRYVYRHYRIDS
jgi:hypothetical protein